MNYFDKLAYWWGKRPARFTVVLILLIGFFVAGQEDSYAYIAFGAFLIVNLMWSSTLNPAWRHTFGAYDWQWNGEMWIGEDFETNTLIGVELIDIDGIDTWAYYVYDSVMVDTATEEPIFVGHQPERVAAAMEAIERAKKQNGAA